MKGEGEKGGERGRKGEKGEGEKGEGEKGEREKGRNMSSKGEL